MASEGPSSPGAPGQRQAQPGRAGQPPFPFELPFCVYSFLLGFLFVYFNQYSNFTKLPSARVGAKDGKALRGFWAAGSEAAPRPGLPCPSVPCPVATHTSYTGTAPGDYGVARTQTRAPRGELGRDSPRPSGRRSGVVGGQSRWGLWRGWGWGSPAPRSPTAVPRHRAGTAGARGDEKGQDSSGQRGSRSRTVPYLTRELSA